MSEISNESRADDTVSKSQRKREAQALFKLGQQLVALTTNQLDALPIPGRVRDAVDEAQRIRSFGARKRQLLFLAKQLREADTDALAEAMAEHLGDGAADRAALHRIERWRDLLLTEGLPAINRLAATHPQLDRQRLRSLVRKASTELERGLPPAASRELFRELRQLDEESALPGSPEGLS